MKKLIGVIIILVLFSVIMGASSAASEFQCPGCGGSEVVDVIIQQATCFRTGLMNVVCANSTCGQVIVADVVTPVNPNLHDAPFLSNITLAPTCRTTGLSNLYCAGCHMLVVCDNVIPIDPSNHDLNYGRYNVVTKPATCIYEGTMNIMCCGCDAIVEADVATPRDPNNHYLYYGVLRDITKQATCLEEGTMNVLCSGCLAILATDILVDIDPYNHVTIIDNYGYAVVDTYELVILPPTYEQDGINGIYCKNCDGLLYMKITQKLRNYESVRIDSNPITTMRRGESRDFDGIINDDRSLGQSDDYQILWSVSNPAMASVDDWGVVTISSNAVNCIVQLYAKLPDTSLVHCISISIKT